MVASLHIRRALSGLGLLAGITLTAGFTDTATADHPCEPTWQDFTSGGQIGLNGVRALTLWNGDLVVGGGFTTAGGQTVNRIARWDGTEWHPFTSGGEIGVNNTVFSLTVWNGDLVAGGVFTTAGGQPAHRIARWDGTEWHPFIYGGDPGIGPLFSTNQVYALSVYNGDLIVGGQFITVGEQTFNAIARWDGSQWHPFISGGETGVGTPHRNVNSFTVHNGDLIVSGRFTTAGGQIVNHIARWDGTQWHPFISGGETGVSGAGTVVINTSTVYNGDLIVGGRFDTAGGQTINRIARWDGSEWHPFISDGETGLSDWVYALTVWNGNLIAGGDFSTAGGQTVDRIARWNGYSWHPLRVGCGLVGVNNTVRALTVYDGLATAGGSFSVSGGGQTVNAIASWKACPYRGPCCLNGAIIDVFADECDAIGGVFFGEEVAPEDVECDPASPPCPADLNGDGVVNVSDLLQLLSAWGFCP